MLKVRAPGRGETPGASGRRQGDGRKDYERTAEGVGREGWSVEAEGEGVKQFKVVGWFEEVMQQIGGGWKCVGKRVLQAPPAGPLGVASERECTITAPLHLHKGCGEPVSIKASPARPVQIKTRCYPICGPLEN